MLVPLAWAQDRPAMATKTLLWRSVEAAFRLSRRRRAQPAHRTRPVCVRHERPRSVVPGRSRGRHVSRLWSKCHTPKLSLSNSGSGSAIQFAG